MTGVSQFQNNFSDELSDFENMIDEEQIEHDFYVDQAPPALFVPNREGDDKVTQMNDRADPDLFDFESEIEPVL